MTSRCSLNAEWPPRPGSAGGDISSQDLRASVPNGHAHRDRQKHYAFNGFLPYRSSLLRATGSTEFFYIADFTGFKFSIRNVSAPIRVKKAIAALRSGARCRIHDEGLFSRFGDEKPVKLVKNNPGRPL